VWQWTVQAISTLLMLEIIAFKNSFNRKFLLKFGTFGSGDASLISQLVWQWTAQVTSTLPMKIIIDPEI